MPQRLAEFPLCVHIDDLRRSRQPWFRCLVNCVVGRGEDLDGAWCASHCWRRELLSAWNGGGTLFVRTAMWKLFLDVEGETFRMEANAIGLLSNGFIAVENRLIKETIW